MISVCMATYNGANYLKEQVDSILTQLSKDDELIVSDDGSTDSTIEILKSYNDSRIKIHANNVRKGVLGNFENALSKANGDYIFLSDQDDVWMDNKVKLCIAALQINDLVMHDAIIWDGEAIISESFYGLRGSKGGYWQNLYRNSFMGCCMAMRRRVLDYVLPIPNISMHDIWIGLMVSKKGRVTLITDKLIRHRRHGANTSKTSELTHNSWFSMIRYRLNCLLKTMVK